MALSIPVEGTLVDNSYFTNMISEINKKAEFHLLARGGSGVSADDWQDDQQNWQPYDSYSQYDFLVFCVRDGESQPQTIWVKTSDICDDGTFYINWVSYSVPGSSYVSVSYNCLGWSTSYVASHTHGGDLSNSSSYCYKATVRHQASTPTYSRTALTYRLVIRYIYGVKVN